MNVICPRLFPVLILLTCYKSNVFAHKYFSIQILTKETGGVFYYAIL